MILCFFERFARFLNIVEGSLRGIFEIIFFTLKYFLVSGRFSLDIFRSLKGFFSRYFSVSGGFFLQIFFGLWRDFYLEIFGLWRVFTLDVFRPLKGFLLQVFSGLWRMFPFTALKFPRTWFKCTEYSYTDIFSNFCLAKLLK